MATIVTKAGRADIATASFEHIQVNWNKYVIGDGNGVSYTPDENRTALVNEVHRGEVAGYIKTDEVTGYFEIVIPADVGGFVIREIGLLNEYDELVALDCLEDTSVITKPRFSSESGQAHDVVIRFGVHIDNADMVRVTIDPYTAVASRGYVDEQLARFNEVDNDDVDRIFEFTGSGSPGGYPEDWEEATEEDIDALF